MGLCLNPFQGLNVPHEVADVSGGLHRAFLLRLCTHFLSPCAGCVQESFARECKFELR